MKKKASRACRKQEPLVGKSIRADAARFRWLMSRTGLRLESTSRVWTRPDGSTFVATHYLASDDTQWGPAEGLRATIDQAVRFQNERSERR
jgi:hypothetical protein